jgi:ribose-phosphate pyrophosphokinase
MRLFALRSSAVFGQKVAAAMGKEPDPHEERDFEDGEHKIRPLVSVRDEDVYIIHALHNDTAESVNDKLCKLLFFIAALKDCGAWRVTAIVPYLCYARKDRRTKARDPLTLRYVAALFDAVGVDHVVTIDVHNLQAYQNAFRCATDHLEAARLFVNYLSGHADVHDMVVMSPDLGGIKRAEHFRDLLSRLSGVDVGFAFMEKMRSAGLVSGDAVVGEMRGKTVVIIDDLVNSGTTLARAAAACKRNGAGEVYAIVTHGVFNDKANEVLQEPSLTGIVVTNTVPVTLTHPGVLKKLTVLDIAPFFGDVIQTMSRSGSLVALSGIES